MSLYARMSKCAITVKIYTPPCVFLQKVKFGERGKLF